MKRLLSRYTWLDFLGAFFNEVLLLPLFYFYFIFIWLKLVLFFQATFFFPFYICCCWMSTSIREKHYKPLCIRWIIIAIVCLTSAAMGICPVKWQVLWLYSVLLCITVNKSSAISADGEIVCCSFASFSLLSVKFLYHIHKNVWGIPK